MAQLLTRRRIYKVLGVLAGAFLATFAAWVVVAGPVSVFRILRYGDTNIDDFSHYPGRRLEPSDSPFEFALSGDELELSSGLLEDYGATGDLDQMLESNDSIAFLVIKDDTILYERYFQGHTVSSLSQAFSMSKSFTSALIGMAIDDGYIGEVNQPITDFVPELTEAGYGDVTFEHLLTMMSGSSYVENDNPFGEHVRLNFTPELERQILGFEMERAPGELFRYKSGDNALLALALDRALGAETITDYTQRRMWDLLGMQDEGVWSTDREDDGLEKTWCCLAASARDFAKLGRLYLSRGSWDGRRILSADWIERSTKPQVPEAVWPSDYYAVGWWNYGYQWWLASPQLADYFALGKDGQLLYLDPSSNVIVLRLGWSSGDMRTSQWIALFQRIAQEAG